ncbi:MAG: VOC family protein [Alphaproteobacteria bacterium]
MEIYSLDHIVLNVGSIEVACGFYQEVLGMRRENFALGRVALHFGKQKINLHRAKGETASPRAWAPIAGGGDFCLLVNSLAAAETRLRDAGITIVAGPVERTGACGPLRSIYCHDPEGNLVELSQARKGAKI